MVKVVRFRRCFFLWLSSSDSLPSLSGESGHTEASPVLLPQHTPVRSGGGGRSQTPGLEVLAEFKFAFQNKMVTPLFPVQCSFY